MRVLLIAACVCMLVVFGARALGSAIGHELQDRVIFTRDGVTLDCRRDVDGVGNVAYNDCSRVP